MVRLARERRVLRLLVESGALLTAQGEKGSKWRKKNGELRRMGVPNCRELGDWKVELLGGSVARYTDIRMHRTEADLARKDAGPKGKDLAGSASKLIR